MAGSRKKNQKSLPKPIKDNRSISSRPDEPPKYLDSYLPAELLELILSRLNLKDNMRASAVCKMWLAVATSLRKANKPPWLMFFDKPDDFYDFYDPETRQVYCLELRELRGCRICYAKDGWLLLFKPNTQDVIFLCPYTREVIKLPNQQLVHQLVAFSAAPTSPRCIVFTVKHITPMLVSLSTCRPGATEWVTDTYQNDLPFVGSIWNKIVFCRGHFYCLSLVGLLGVYNPDNRTWRVGVVPPPKCMRRFPVDHWSKGKFMLEHNGDIFVIFTCPELNPFIYKLDKTTEKWVEMVDLGGMTYFANSLSSVVRSDVHGKMRNNVYFSKVLYYGKRCVTYSPNNDRYYPRKQRYDWGEEDRFHSIWIEPPEDLSIFR